MFLQLPLWQEEQVAASDTALSLLYRESHRAQCWDHCYFCFALIGLHPLLSHLIVTWLYTNDMLLYRPICNNAAMSNCRKTSIEYWNGWMLTTPNTEKCKFMRVTRKQTGVCPQALYLSWRLASHCKRWTPVSWDPTDFRSIMVKPYPICGKARKLTGQVCRHFYQCSTHES